MSKLKFIEENGITLSILIMFGAILFAACGSKAQSNSTATVIASPLAGYTCFAVGTGGNCVKD